MFLSLTKKGKKNGKTPQRVQNENKRVSRTLRQSETDAGRGEAGGELHSKTVRATEAMKKKIRRKGE